MNGSPVVRWAAFGRPGARALAFALLVLVAFVPGCSSDDDNPVAENGDPTTDPDLAQVAGRVTRIDGLSALPGMRITVSPWFEAAPVARQAPGTILLDSSNRDGEFKLSLPEGSWALRVDGWDFNQGGDQYFSARTFRLDVEAGDDLRLDHPIRLIERSGFDELGWNGIEDLSLDAGRIRADLLGGGVSFPEEIPRRAVQLYSLPSDMAASELPPRIWPSSLVELLPNGLVLGEGARLVYQPNFEPAEGTVFDVWAIDASGRDFVSIGTLTVDESGAATNDAPILFHGTQFFVAPQERDLIGRVLVDGEPTADVLVQVLPDNWNGFTRPVLDDLSVRTNANGEFRIDAIHVDSGQIELTLESAEGAFTNTYNFNSEDNLGDLVLGGGEWKIFDVVGTVIDPAGDPVPFTRVDINRNFGAVGPEAIETPLGRTILPASTETDADGRFAFADVVAAPEEFLSVFQISDRRFLGRASSRGAVRFQAPAADITVAEIEVELRLCDVTFGCGFAGLWTLSADTLSINGFNFECQITEEQASNELFLASLSDGRLILERIGTSEVFFLERVAGAGPSGLSESNLVGLYRRREQGGTTESSFAQYVYIAADGTFRALQIDGDAGTATVEDDVVDLAPVYPNPGSDAVRSFRFVRQGERIALYRGAVLAHELERCGEDRGEGLDGTWAPREGAGFDATTLMIHDGEYLLGAELGVIR